MNKANNNLLIVLIVIILMGSVIHGTAKATEQTNIEKEKIDAKRIIGTVCTKCHNINRIVFSPDRDVRDWIRIIAFANRKEHFITKEELAAVVEWLKVHINELKPAPVDLEELAKGFDPKTKEFLIKNNCLVCHNSDRIQQKAGLLSAQEWKGIIYRMKLKAPDLLKNTSTEKSAEYLSNFHLQAPDDIAEDMKDVIDRLEKGK